MATKNQPRTRFLYQKGAFGAAISAAAEALAEDLQLAEGEELELRREDDGRIVVERVRPKILAPVSDVAGRGDRSRKIADSIDEVARDHHGLFALLAR
jgi:antitoxin component of MazEF toxin-antitoxin module